ncbi:MAG: hypothetical protein WCA49_17955 [Candidatus Sulfotelmatobacter sp.]
MKFIEPIISPAMAKFGPALVLAFVACSMTFAQDVRTNYMPGWAAPTLPVAPALLSLSPPKSRAMNDDRSRSQGVRVFVIDGDELVPAA